MQTMRVPAILDGGLLVYVLRAEWAQIWESML